MKYQFKIFYIAGLCRKKDLERVQGVTKRKEKSNSLFWHENAIKIFFSTQIIICHMHPFTLVTKTYL